MTPLYSFKTDIFLIFENHQLSTQKSLISFFIAPKKAIKAYQYPEFTITKHKKHKQKLLT